MIPIPPHIQTLRAYKPGKPQADLFDGKESESTAILCSNENNFGPSPKAIEAIRANLGNLHLYPDPTGSALREKLSKRLNVPLNQILVSNGSDGILYTLFKAFCQQGESLLTSASTFVSTAVMAKMHNIECVEIPMLAGYRFDLDCILSAIKSNTRIIYLCSPNNPTGAMITRAELDRFLPQVPDHILVVVDEAYFEFAKSLSDEDFVDASRYVQDNVLVLRTFSKAYGLAGIRLGYGIGATYLIEALTKVKLTFNPNYLAQVAGIGALDDDAFLSKTLANNKQQIQRFYSLFEELSIVFVPSFGNFVMIDLHSEGAVEQMYEQLKARGILIRRLASFGLPHCARVSVGTTADNEYYIHVMRELYS